MPTSRFKPLPEDLSPEVRNLAEHLRLLFDESGKTINGYAREKSLSARVISQFLHGRQIPPPDFISSLLKDVADTQRRPLSPEDIEKSQQLRLKAIEANTKAQYEVEHLRMKLEVANWRREQADGNLKMLVEVIGALHSEIGIVKEEGRELESPPRQKAISPRAQRELEQRRQDKHIHLVRTQDGIQYEIERLNGELAEARAAKELAEKKCNELELAFKEALKRLAIMGGIIGRPDLELPKSIMAYVDDRKMRWGGIIGWFIGPLTTFALPAYLGAMYRLISDQSKFLQISTLAGLVIPVWFAYGIKRLERAGVSRAVHLVYVLVVTAIIFYVTSMLPFSIWFPGLYGR